MAASNHLVALPALIAARRLGIPLPMKWLLGSDKMSREESYRETPAYQVQERLEAAIAGGRPGLHADRADGGGTGGTRREREHRAAAQFLRPDGLPASARCSGRRRWAFRATCR
jgi:hypothetical protein